MGTNSRAVVSGTGSRLRKLRELFKCSRIDMARRLEISRSTYNRNECGDTFPNMKTLKQMSVDHDISMDWFIFGKGPMYFKEKDTVNEQEQEIEKMKKELAAAQEKAAALEQEQEKAGTLQKKISQIEQSPEVIELLENMDRVPLLFHEVLAFFQRFKKENRELVELPPDEAKQNQTG